MYDRKVIAKPAPKKQYEVPPEGTCSATLAEVKDLGEVDTNFGKKFKVLFVWITDFMGADGTPIRVYERFSNTLHPKGNLSPRLKQITGEWPDQETEFDLSALQGTRGQLVIQHNEADDGRVFANVTAFVRLPTPAEAADDARSDARVRKVIDAAKKKGSR
jgi:hypothetical protein